MLQGLNLLISLGIMTLLFAMIFKLMPTAPIAWRDVWIGAGVTAVLFEFGKLLIGLYLGKSGVTQAFAAAGSLAVLVAWVYYAAQIFLLGAEFTKVYADEHGSLAGQKAVAQTAAAAATGDVPTKGDQASTALPVATDVPDYSGLSRTARVQAEIDQRVERASRRLVHQALMLAVITLEEGFARRKAKLANRRAAEPRDVSRPNHINPGRPDEWRRHHKRGNSSR